MAVLMDEKILVLLGAEGVGLTPLITCSLAKPGCQVDQFVRPIPPNSHRLSAFIVACQTIRVNIAKKILFLHFFLVFILFLLDS